MHPWLRLRAAAFTTLASLVLLSAPAIAADTPLKAWGGGSLPSGLALPGQITRPLAISGRGSLLGQTTGTVLVALNAAMSIPSGVSGSWYSQNPLVLVAADGSELHGTLSGSVEIQFTDVLVDGAPLVEAAMSGTFTPVPDQSTGRFAGLSGSAQLDLSLGTFVLGASDPIALTWTLTGSLTR